MRSRKTLKQKAKSLWILVAGSLLLVLGGCFDAKMTAMTGGKWPELPVPEELVLDQKEVAALQKFSKENSGLAEKIKKQSDAYRNTILAYNKQSRKHNREVIEAFGQAAGWSREDILRALQEVPNDGK